MKKESSCEVRMEEKDDGVVCSRMAEEDNGVLRVEMMKDRY